MNTNIENVGGGKSKTEEEIFRKMEAGLIARRSRSSARPFRRVMKLENLSPQLLDELRGLAERGTIDEVWEKLKSWRKKVSRATVARFVRTTRQEEALAARDEMAETAEKLVEAKKGEVFRAGAMEALRQNLFDRALGSEDPAEGLRVYGALVAEEEKLKKLEIERERAQMQREALELQRERLRIEAARGNGKLFVEALKILRDERLEAGVKVARVVERLQSCAPMIELGGAQPGAEGSVTEERTEGAPPPSNDKSPTQK